MERIHQYGKLRILFDISCSGDRRLVRINHLLQLTGKHAPIDIVTDVIGVNFRISPEFRDRVRVALTGQPYQYAADRKQGFYEVAQRVNDLIGCPQAG